MKEFAAEYAGWIVAVTGGVTTFLFIVRKTRLFLRGIFGKWNAGFDTLVGRDPIVHPDTGIVLVPATPGLGTRLATMEEAIVGLSNTQAQLSDVREQVLVVSATLTQHINESAEANRMRSDEQRSMWDAIKAVAESRPPAELTTIHTERSV